MGVKAFGARVTRFEDPALLTGRGRYVDDLPLPGALHACFVRSPHAHALVTGIEVSAARNSPGVHAVLTADNLPGAMRDSRIPDLMHNPAATIQRTQHALARDEVCYVGQAVAVVLAEDRYQAEDAAALVDVAYDLLPVVSDTFAALEPGSPTAHRDLPDNVAWSRVHGFGDVDAAFAGATHIVEDTFRMNRGSGMPMECRAVAARYDSIDDRLTVWSSTQTPHLGRRILADLLGRHLDSIRYVAPDVGGGFGLKAPFYPEEAVIPAAAMLTGRPVRWCEDRRENFLASAQERDQFWTLALAFDADGKLRGVRGSLVQDTGAFMPWGLVMPTIGAVTVPGPYVVPAYRLETKVAINNKVPIAPVRGAGRPQAVFAMERMLDRAARELGLAPDEIRRRNLVGPELMPYAVGLMLTETKPMVYQDGDYPQAQRKAIAAADYGGFAVRQKQARENGRFLGIGLANYVEGTGLGPFEAATVQVLPSGKVTVVTGAASQGQGTKTTLAQIVADRIGCALENVEVTIGDTAAIPYGFGAYASRQAIVSGSAAHEASLVVRARIVALAAQTLGVPEADIDVEDGSAIARSGNRPSIALGDLARLAQGAPGIFYAPGGATGLAPGLEATAHYAPPQSSFCNGTHIAEVEVDPMTGGVTILRYTIAHDSGVLINPMIVDGQVQGGTAHGIGNALLEWMKYDDDGNPLTTSLQDYLLPSAPEVPNFAIVHVETPNPLNPLGVKGAGEGGTIPSPAAIVSAIEDALACFGARFTSMPLTPEMIVAALREAGAYDTLTAV